MHTGSEQIFFLSDFFVTIVTAAVEEDAGFASFPYPNPSSGVVWLPFTIGPFRVFDTRGRLVFEGAGSRADLSHLPRGTYIIRTRETSHLITIR